MSGRASTLSEPTSTERLRALLDERGVEWSSPSGLNSSFADSITFIGDVAVVSEIDGSDLLRINFDGTPEQAVEATLGAEDAYTREDVEGGGQVGDGLRPCPFCGASGLGRVLGGLPYDGELDPRGRLGMVSSGGDYYAIRCRGCDMRGPNVRARREDAVAAAIDAWNRRARVLHGMRELGVEVDG